MRSPIKIIKIDGSHSYLRSKLRCFSSIFYCFSLDIKGEKVLTEISVWTLMGKKFKLLRRDGGRLGLRGAMAPLFFFN